VLALAKTPTGQEVNARTESKRVGRLLRNRRAGPFIIYIGVKIEDEGAVFAAN